MLAVLVNGSIKHGIFCVVLGGKSQAGSQKEIREINLQIQLH